ncbi:hypothetical protein GA830_05650 [Mesorhizobium sp. NBSH29]|uniref:DUF6194 family protein n=1 Tax=Mesorhizobium sp. NBSH29 TaxID=2654249 RepID=UPI0018967E72|nr:DUF6194 family protein [Mesorhizobium sp. NBSH29]QPC86281.1 hypothetical protein GA830_05650 [Mesorhizobium sp. NBSH29]
MTDLMPTKILTDLLDRYEGTVAVKAWGEISLFYNPGAVLPRGVYFATIKEKDGENDRASMLDRDGIFRLNIGTSKPLYFEKFGPPPPRPSKGRIVEGGWNFTKLDELTPHPIYGWMSWIAVLNPSMETLGDIRPLIDAAFDKAVFSFKKGCVAKFR